MEDEWNHIVRAAEKEGQVNVYIAGSSAVIQRSGVCASSSGTDLTTRLASERRAGKYIADVYSAPAIKLLE